MPFEYAASFPREAEMSLQARRERLWYCFSLLDRASRDLINAGTSIEGLFRRSIMDNHIEEMVRLLYRQGGIIRSHERELAIEALKRYWADKIAAVWCIEDIAIAIGQINLTDEQAAAILRRLREKQNSGEAITKDLVQKTALELGKQGILPINPYGPPTPALRYFVVHVEEVEGEKNDSYTVKVVYSGTDTAENVALGVGINTNCELDPDPFDRDNFWFQSHSIGVKKVVGEEITFEKFQQNDYLTEMRVSDEDIRRAIAYRKGEPSEAWWIDDEDAY